MLLLRRACAALGTVPLVLASCTDVSGFSAPPPDAGDDASAPPPNPPPTPTDDAGALAPCPVGQKSCNGGCVSTDDPDYGCSSTSCERCPALPFVATYRCIDGVCGVGTCKGGHSSCNDAKNADGCEADHSEAKTCGGCSTSCADPAPYCTPSGQCVISCDPSLMLCGTSCVDIGTSISNCGGCGVACPALPNADPTCVAKSCSVACRQGFGDCDGNPGNGCETPLKPYYVDKDGDGVGTGVKVGEACTAPPGHSLVSGDCNDDNAKVHPGVTDFIAVGYTDAKGQTSYDYDCNGVEEPDSTKPRGACTACKLGDYVITTRSNAPPNAIFYCGSTAKISGCSSTSSSSTCSSMSSSSGFGCR